MLIGVKLVLVDKIQIRGQKLKDLVHHIHRDERFVVVGNELLDCALEHFGGVQLIVAVFVNIDEQTLLAVISDKDVLKMLSDIPCKERLSDMRLAVIINNNEIRMGHNGVVEFTVAAFYCFADGILTVKVIHILLDNIDPKSNMWTRKEATNFHSAVDVNIDRDEIEIRSYMTKIVDNSFSELHPEIAKEWHPTKNGALSPNKVKSGPDIKVWWQCPACGNNYMASISHRVAGTGCPQCGKAKQVAKRSKAVQMIDLESDKVICTFPSISEASRQMKISSGNISAVGKNGRSKAGRYYWKYLR